MNKKLLFIAFLSFIKLQCMEDEKFCQANPKEGRRLYMNREGWIIAERQAEVLEISGWLRDVDTIDSKSSKTLPVKQGCVTTKPIVLGGMIGTSASESTTSEIDFSKVPSLKDLPNPPKK